MVGKSGGTVTRSEQLPGAGRSARLGRLGPLLTVVHIGWALPSAAGGTLLQALLAEQRGDSKVTSLAALTTIGAVVAVVSTVVAGSLSDRTRSRFGRRNPWILGGAVAAATGLTLTGALPWFPAQIIAFALFQGGMSAMLAAVGALLPDRVAKVSLGKASALAGLGYLIGTAVGGVVASAVISAPAWGLGFVGWTMVVAALLVFFLARDRSSRDLPRETVSARERLRDLLPPRDRDFVLAFAGRFCMILGLLVVVFYQLYLFTDFLHLSTTSAAEHIAVGTVLLGVTAMVATVVGGLLSDRLGRRKPLVIAASALIAAAAVPVAIAPGVGTMMVFYLVGGFGFGVYLSVDQALMVEILPNAGAEAKELGMLAVANSAPSVLSPVIAAAVVSVFGFHSLFLFTILIAAAGAGCIGAIRRVR